MPSESKRLARLIPLDTLEAVSNPSFPNRAYTFQRTSALYGVSLEAHRPHVSVMHLPRSHSGTHTSVLSHLGQASIFGGGGSVPYRSPDTYPVPPAVGSNHFVKDSSIILCTLYLSLRYPPSPVSTIFGLLQGYYVGSANIRWASVDLGTFTSHRMYPGFAGSFTFAKR